MTKLTTNETAILKGLHEFQYVDGQDLTDLGIWTWSFTDDAAAAAGISLKAVKGVVSSLVKKGYLVGSNPEDEADQKTITVTAAGAEMNAELNASPTEQAEEQAPQQPLTRKQCIEALAELGYEGPTSYLMPKLRGIVEAVRAHADHKEPQTDCDLCPETAVEATK